ncbi:hypothetical protein ADH76_18520 [Enterocloster clostridioformis]|uniref:hypothetical protein n=2 Tax=Enterocloster clostridioformis TaxID=1531 RepID=UPI00080C6EFF|nr:hypothetical protein [Enterocloster clostridioformis]ANU47797.1 hypothetical protein A4V08_20285 [Lachnoclostridium sp. YL32]NDO30552.1 hypothetical protein [Enterocloster clostridioformis]OXE66017.1 hypothetical protein ADH76_18520 [Enterocloster clostridioformis]QQR03299.1 hypothetical protein I5Q83_14515 [Enterocloster clostridioformis]
MNIYKKWTIQLKNNISGGNVMQPTIDTFDKSTFYISDGWGTAFAALRFRKLSLETGEELANTLTRDGARCIHITKENIFVILSKKILKLNRNDLSIQYTYKQNIPRDIDCVSSDDFNALLLTNCNSQYFYNFNMQLEKNIKKKVGECCGITKINIDTFLLFNYDGILQYSLKTNTIKKMVSTEPYSHYIKGNSGRVYILCEKPIQNINDEGENSPYSSRILVYSPISENNPQEIITGKIFNDFSLSEDERLLYLHKDNTLWLYSIIKKEIIFEYTFQDEFIFNIFIEGAIVMTYNRNYHNLTCWKIEA